MSSITIAFFSLQMFDVDGHWNHLQARMRLDLLLMLLKSKAKRDKKEILRFL